MENLQGEEVSKKLPERITYKLYRKAPLSKKCVFTIRYSDADTPPKRMDLTVKELCRIECDWDKTFEEWTPVGDPGEGWRRHDDLTLAMRFEGEPKWKVRIGSNQEVERDAKVDYMG